MASPVQLRTTFFRPDRLRLVYWLGFSIAVGLMLMALFAHGAHQSGAGLCLMLASFGLGVVSTRRGTRARQRTEGPVRVDAAGVRLGGAFVSRDSIRSAYFVPAAGETPAHVRLVGLEGGVLADVDVYDPPVADRVLDALGIGVQDRVARFLCVMPSTITVGMALRVGGLVAFAMFLDSMAKADGPLVTISVALIAVFSFALVNCEVHVGADGLLFALPIGSRFVPWSDVDAIELRGSNVVFRTCDGDLKVPVRSVFVGYDDYEKATPSALFERARKSLNAYRQADEAHVEARVARRGRSLKEWIGGLNHFTADYRSAPVLEETLWRIVESPSATATARAGAAAVIAGSGKPDQVRLRVAAEACALPRLRVVLEMAGAGASEEELCEALSALDEDAYSMRAI